MNEFYYLLDDLQIHVDMQITDLEYRKIFKHYRQFCRLYDIVGEDQLLGVAQSAPIQAGHHKGDTDQDVGSGEILDVKPVETLAEYLGFMLALDAKSLPRMHAS